MKLEKYSSDQEFQGDKRTYMPYILKWKCTKCSHSNETDFGDQYIGYPPLNMPFDQDLYCINCDNEDDSVKLEISLDIVYDPIILRAMPQSEAKELIEEYILNNEGKLTSDIIFDLGIDVDIVLDSLKELAEEGKVHPQDVSNQPE